MYVKPKEKYLAFEPRTGTKSLIYSQGKLTMLRCKIEKLQTKPNLKSKLTAP
jgi:hypothetical protein